MKLIKQLLIPLILIALGIGILDTKKEIKSHKCGPIQSIKLEDTIDKVINSVVYIKNESRGWQGSGVVIREDIILTARHVVEGGEDFTITTNDGTEIKAVKAVSHKKYDMAFIKIDKSILKSVIVGSIKGCRLGQSIFVIGSPYGKLNFNSVTFGIISGLNRSCDFKDWNRKDYGWSITFTTDAAGHPGNSGCPIFTTDGVLRGILVGGYSPVLIYCIPVDIILGDGAYIDILFGLEDYYIEKEMEYESPYY